jgi:hypothetical protein
VNTRETFYAARRAYRAAHNVPLTAEGAVQSCLAATSLLRAITGRWDTCEPCASGGWAYRPYKRHWIARPIVTNTCRQFVRRTLKEVQS